MAQTIKLKRSSTEGKVPIVSNLALGELGINTYDGRIFLKKNDGSDSIEHVVTTDSITTGSITITGTVDAGTLTTTNLIDKQYLDDEVLNASLNAFTQSAITVTGNGTSGSMPVFSGTHTVVNSGIRSLTAETIVTHDNDTNIIFTVSGSNGELLTVTDSNTGNLLEINDSSGIDVFTVSATGDVSASGDITASGFVFDDLTVPGDVTLTGLSAQSSEATSLMINASNVIGTRELGSNAFTSTAFENKASGTHTLVSGSSQVIGILSSLNSFSASNGNASLNAYTQSAASVNDTTITLTGGTGVNSLGDFTLNQSSTEAFVFSVDSSSLAGNVLTAATDGTGLDVTVGDGIEVNSSALRVKLDGSTIDRTSSGIKLSDENLNTSLNSFSASNGNDSLNSFTASNANTSLNTFTASNANTSLNAATSSYLTAHPSITQGSNISSDNSDGTVIQDLTITLDSNGHVTTATAGTVDLDGRYYTETESDARFEDIASGTHTLVSGSSQLSYATSTARGVIELFSSDQNGEPANAVTDTSGRTYGIQLNSDNQAVVNVPWTADGGNATTLDNIDSSGFIRANADDDVSAHTEWQDSKQIRLGSGNDAQLYHNGTNMFLANGTGNLIIRNNTDNGNVILQSDDGSGGVTNYLYLDGTNVNVQVDKRTRFNDTSNSTTKSNGGVVFSGGVGIVKTLNVGEDVVAFASSDERYKDNVTPIENPNEKLKQIGGYTFDWNDKHEVFKGQHDVGVIAQEIEKVLPEIVETRESGYKAVKYEKIVALLIESNKELLKRIEDLESKIK